MAEYKYENDCEYCSGKKPLAFLDFDYGKKLVVDICGENELSVWVDHGVLYHEEYIKINYCPMCGRELPNK